MNLKVIMFGRLAEIAGNTVAVNNVADTDSLVKVLNQNYPALADTKYVIAVDKKIITGNTSLTEGSIIALLPPFSGG